MLNLIFKDKIIILKLFLIPYISNLIVGFILRPKTINNNQLIKINNSKTFIETLLESIKKSMNTMLIILGTITLFFILNAIINPLNNPLISGFLEISQGLKSLELANLSINVKQLYTLLFVCFGGLSIILQIKSILTDTNISLKTFIKARLIQTLIAIILLII